eukprot:5692356-Pyramimonas_sp.AAC.1
MSHSDGVVVGRRSGAARAQTDRRGRYACQRSYGCQPGTAARPAPPCPRGGHPEEAAEHVR